MEVHRERTAAAEPEVDEAVQDEAVPDHAAQDHAAQDDAAVFVRVRYFAGARAAAGVGEETLRVAAGTSRSGGSAGPGGAAGVVTAAEVIEAVSAAHPGKVERVLASCSFLLDGVAVRDRGVEVGEGSQFDVLPPFAGG